jgi:hypothetical protein
MQQPPCIGAVRRATRASAEARATATRKWSGTRASQRLAAGTARLSDRRATRAPFDTEAFGRRPLPIGTSGRPWSPKSARNRTKPRASQCGRTSEDNAEFAGVSRRRIGPRGLPENRGVSGSSPGLAIGGNACRPGYRETALAGRRQGRASVESRKPRRPITCSSRSPSSAVVDSSEREYCG